MESRKTRTIDVCLADRQVMSRIEEPSNREGLEMLELTRAGLDAAMPAGKGAGAGQQGELLSFLQRTPQIHLFPRKTFGGKLTMDFSVVR